MPPEQPGPDFFEENFGACPHGGIKPYCPQCAGDEVEEARAKRREKREARETENRLKETVSRQSDELDAAYAYIRSLERRGSR